MRRNFLKLFLFAVVSLSLLHLRPEVHAGSFMDKFIDPKDGKFDASDWLLHRRGFLPVPIIITELAVGYGGGAALLFFHQSMDEKIAEMQTDSGDENVNGKKTRLLPPSISGVMGALTENETWAAGGFHFGSWKADRIRYLGALAKASINIAYYGKDENSLLKNGIDYNLEGWGIVQELKFRIKDTDFFLGGKLTYFDAKSTFDFGRIPIGIDQWEIDFKNVGLGMVFKYDSRDNIFTPSQGLNTDISAMFYNGEGLLDRTREYQIITFGY